MEAKRLTVMHMNRGWIIFRAKALGQITCNRKGPNKGKNPSNPLFSPAYSYKHFYSDIYPICSLYTHLILLVFTLAHTIMFTHVQSYPYTHSICKVLPSYTLVHPCTCSSTLPLCSCASPLTLTFTYVDTCTLIFTSGLPLCTNVYPMCTHVSHCTITLPPLLHIT